MNPQYSRDYKALYPHLIGGGEAIGTVQRDSQSKTERREAITFKCASSSEIGILSGEEYRYYGDIQVYGDGSEAPFVATCEKLNVEFVTPGTELLKAEERIDSLLDLLGRLLKKRNVRSKSGYDSPHELHGSDLWDEARSLLNPQDHGNDK